LADSRDQPSGVTDVAPEPLPKAPRGASRIDTLPEDFFRFLSRRPLVVGDVIGQRYKLLHELGHGGMGQVFSAENLSIGRPVAVKVLKPELLADGTFRKRFQHEAMAIAAVDHRNVVRFVDLVVGDPTFLVMELVRGPTLAQVLKQEGRLEVARAINLTRRLGWGLEAVHRAGIVHRDLKPANVLLSPDPELGEEPKIIDFGLAKLGSLAPEEQLTRAGQVVGTPHYMSPEQVAGREIDPRSDVFSLGCLLYHMLAGRPPSVGEDDMQVLYQQVHVPADPLRKHSPDVPEDLMAVVMRAIEKDPEARFATMADMLTALSTVNRRRSISSVESMPVAKEPRRRRGALPVAAACLAAALGLAAVGWWPRLTARGGALLIVSSRPDGAKVTLDGKALDERTPTSIRGVSAGTHRIRIEDATHAPVDQVVDVSSGHAVVDIRLPARSREVRITSLPSGATVFLDGAQVGGETPLAVSIADDDFHELRVEKIGFEPETKGIAPDEAGPVELTLAPEERARGRLWVDANQSAEVLIDGKSTSYLTPTGGITLSAGEHAVALRDSTGRTGEPTRFTLRKGESLHVSLSAPGAACAPVKP
jgi:serine/threonine protein kinase